MSRTMKRLIGIFLATVLLFGVHAQDDDQEPAQEGGEAPKPEDVPEHDTTNGVIGAMTQYFWPVTTLLLQYCNSALIHTIHKQLPCTISSITPFKWECSDLKPEQESE